MGMNKFLRKQVLITLIILLLIVILCLNVPILYAETQTALSSASAYALIEQSSLKPLKSFASDKRLPMASTTKTMTALVVLENCSLDELVTVSDMAVGVEGSSMYLQYGEVISVKDLLYGLMLLSGNDAAVALAVHVAGSVDGFVEMMNNRADEMGLVNTHFVTPNGLHDDEHYTTAFELAVMGAEALKNDNFKAIVSTEYYTSSTGNTERVMKNKNSLLWDYDGALGIKTGYTMAAGRCLLFAAQRDGMTIVGAVLNCRPMFEAAMELLEYGFDNYTMCYATKKDERVATCFVPNATKSILAMCAKSDIIIPVKKGEKVELQISFSKADILTAPIFKGETIGVASLFFSGECIGQTELIAAETVSARNFMFYFNLVLKALGK